jgi:hypothetical protein
MNSNVAAWIGAGSAVLVMLSGTAANLFMMGRFIGQWSEALRNLGTTLNDVEKRMERVEDAGDNLSSKVGLMNQRLGHTESAAAKFWEMRDAFIAMKMTVEMGAKAQQEKLEALTRGQAVIERQLGNLVTTRSRSGFTEISTNGGKK